MDKRAQFLTEYRTYLKICKQLADTMLPTLDKGSGLDDEIIAGKLFQQQRESVARMVGLGDPEKIFNTLSKGLDSSVEDIMKTEYPTFDETLAEQPTIYAVVEDLRKYKNKNGGYQKHLLVQVNGDQFKVKIPIHTFLQGIDKKYNGNTFHFKKALDWVYYSEEFNPHEDFPTYREGMKDLFKSAEEKRLRDLVLESLGNGIYRCKIDYWFF